MDRLPDHDRMVEEELFRRLAEEMGPMADVPGERSRLRTSAAAVLVVLGLATVVMGLSISWLASAAGYAAALFGLVALAPVLDAGFTRFRVGLVALHRAR